ncbi:MAG: hypothetical protein M1133_00005, partial [Armatimonadetes bacterium]|nr:hypothetical protein [Armatimonadota bacterium]
KNDYATTLVLYWYMQGQISYPRTENLRALRRADMMEDIRAVVARPWKLDSIRREAHSRQLVWYRFSTESYDDERSDLSFLKEFIDQFVSGVGQFGEQSPTESVR